jgi:imidazolonepropionase-like amidohydrolase
MKLGSAALACIASLTCLAAHGQAGKEELHTPPPEAQKFVIVSGAGQHGAAWRWRTAAGADIVRESIVLRGRKWEQEMTVHVGANGQPERIEVRGSIPSGDAAESFSIVDGQAQWKTQIDSGRVAYDGRSHYMLAGGTWAAPLLAELIHRAPGRETSLLPAGKARMKRLVDVAVGSGPTAKTVTSWAIEGIYLRPMTVLLDSEGRYFGWAATMALLPEAYVADHAKLHKAQIEALATQQPGIAKRFGAVSPVPVVFANVRLFDAEGARFVDDQSVVIDAGRIVAVGPASSVKVPAGARMIDGRGKTLTPGIWDAHLHAGPDQQGVMLLSLGETSARDPGADIQRALLRRNRIAAGDLLYPTLHSSVLIDGRGPFAAQLAKPVASEQEALEAVRDAKRNGFFGVKFYGSLDPQWLRAAVPEARKLGMHVHGHVPAAMRPSDAIAAGYEEITHINFILMQAMPDDVVIASNGVARFEGPGRYAKDVDLDKEPIASLIKDMARKRIAVDPTLVVFERVLASEHGILSPAYAPYVGTLPPASERDFRRGGDAPPAGVSRADYRASFRKMLELTKRLHDAGVPIVAGTDGGGLEIVRELELYVEAGLTPAQALQTATINPARLTRADKTTGSIAPGKFADLVLVEGDPSRNIGDMRHTRWVMQRGALMNADELREAAGFSGRPK